MRDEDHLPDGNPSPASTERAKAATSGPTTRPDSEPEAAASPGPPDGSPPASLTSQIPVADDSGAQSSAGHDDDIGKSRQPDADPIDRPALTWPANLAQPRRPKSTESGPTPTTGNTTTGSHASSGPGAGRPNVGESETDAKTDPATAPAHGRASDRATGRADEPANHGANHRTQPGVHQRAREGVAGGADRVGRSVGAANAGRFVRRSGSDGTVGGDLKQAVAGGADGAKLGAGLGGVGAPVGAAAGAVVQAAKTKTGRRMWAACLLGPPALLFVLILMIITLLTPSVTGGMATQNEGDALEAGRADGVGYQALGIYQEAARDAGIPWEVLAAIVEVQQAGAGDPHDAREAAPLDDRRAAAAVAGNEPVGPYKMTAGDATADAYRVGVDLDVATLTDLRAASRFVARLLDRHLAETAAARPEHDVTDLDLSAGVVISDGSEGGSESADRGGDAGDGGQRFILGSDPSGNGLGLNQDDTDEDGDGDPGNDGDHIAVREVYREALRRMPIADAELNGTRIFDMAMAWHLGRSIRCGPQNQPPAGTPVASGAPGAWANPTRGAITSPFGMRVHPITGVYKLHDGTDISSGPGNTDIGQPVYAASAGTVTVSGESWAGDNLVTIDHGNGLQTRYGHMSAATVATGDTVTAGQQIGKVGNEGLSGGAHLHFMVLVNSEAIDPEPFMTSHHVTLGQDRTGGRPSTAPPAQPAASDRTSDLATGDQSGGWTGTASTGEAVTLNRTQLGYAATIATVGQRLGVPADGIVVALMTVFPESGFRNYASSTYPETIGLEYPAGSVGSDHDSVGLFQQRPQAGWGTPSQLMDPTYAARAFYGGSRGPNHGSPAGLLDHPGWQHRSKGEAAQDVQASAFPDRYAPWEPAAVELLDYLITENAAGGIPGAGALSAAEDCANPPKTPSVDGFTVATFNVLGAGHTGTGRDKPAWPAANLRFPKAMGLLEEAGVSVAGLQEMHTENQRYLHSDFADVWGYTGGTQEFVVWRKDQWRLVRTEHLWIPFTAGRGEGDRAGDRAQPMVLLEQTATGRKAWFLAVHHAAGRDDGARQRRLAALRAEQTAVQAKRTDGFPVVVLGDFNDYRDSSQRAQCLLGRQLDNAFGAPGRNCEPPPGDARVDHIFSDAPMADARVDPTPIRDKVSDHPLVTADVLAHTAANNAVDSPGQGSGGDCASVEDNPISQAGLYAPNAVKISDCVLGAYDQLVDSIGGYRSSSISGNHETGCALDMMIAAWDTPTGISGGDQIARWLRSHAQAMGVQYLIWRQRIWSVTRADEGWRPMAARGTPDSDHLTHLHASVYGSQCVIEV